MIGLLSPERAARLLVVAMREARTLGDFEGHPFRGNQYTENDIPQKAGAVTRLPPTLAGFGERQFVYSPAKDRFVIGRDTNQQGIMGHSTMMTEAGLGGWDEQDDYFIHGYLGEKSWLPEGLIEVTETDDNREYAYTDDVTRGDNLYKFYKKLDKMGLDTEKVKVRVKRQQGDKTIRERLRAAGDYEGHPFRGNQHTRGRGEPDPSPEQLKAEADRQTALAAKQTNPLAHPLFVLGSEVPYAKRYVAAYGAEHKAAPLPEGVERGKMGECYKNASLLVMTNPELTYAEGFAKNAKTGDFVFQHAWAVTKDGTVVDNTWDAPEKNQYFGVTYDRGAYLKYLYTAKLYGVLGSTMKNAHKAVTSGAHALRMK